MKVDSATPNTTVYNQDTPVGETKAKPLSPAMLEVVRQFGLEDDAALRDALLESPIGQLDGSTLLTLSDKLDGMSQSMADVYSVMLLISKMSQQQREASRGIRDAEQQSQLTSMQEGADKIREAADFALAAGIVSGVVKMGSGAISIGGGLKGLKDLKSIDAAGTPDLPTAPSTKGADGSSGSWVKGTIPGKQDADVPAAGPAMTSADLKLEQIRAQGRVFDGSSQVVGGAGEVIASGLTRASEEARAEEKELDAQAKSHEMSAEKESDFMSVNRDMIQKVAEMIREIARLKHDSEKSAATI